MTTLQSALDWWVLAGVDIALDEVPRDWRAKVPARPAASSERPDAAPVASPESDAVERASPPPMPAVPAAPAAVPAPIDPPEDFEAFRQWWVEAPNLPFAPPRVRRCPIVGPARARLMIITDQPEDAGEDGLAPFAGDADALVARMTAALGLTSESVLNTALFPVPTSAMRQSRDIAPLAQLQRHLIKLAQPERILLFGNEVSRAMFGGQIVADLRGRLLDLEGVPAVVTLPPRHLLQRPADKALVWADLLKLGLTDA